MAFMIKAIITALPAKPIAGPVNTKMAPPIMAAIPTMTISNRFRERTRLCWCGWIGVKEWLSLVDINFNQTLNI